MQQRRLTFSGKMCVALRPLLQQEPKSTDETALFINFSFLQIRRFPIAGAVHIFFAAAPTVSRTSLRVQTLLAAILVKQREQADVAS